jgi:beta-lactamase regulating signal transducer with metallopeptidase domain
MSISASSLILAVFLLRILLKNAPKSILCLLWSLVAIRLICPFSFESNFSVIPGSVSTGAILSDWTETYVGGTQMIYDTHEGYDAAVESGREPVGAGKPEHFYVVTAGDGISEPPTVANTWIPALTAIWLMGAFAMLLYAAVSCLSLRRRVMTAIPLQNDLFLCDEIDTPFILGTLKPRIYLPSSLKEAQSSFVISHENAHIKRHDHWWKPLGFALLALYWFNPLCWLAYLLLCRDIELACDEKAVKDMDIENKKAYSHALLSSSLAHPAIAACPLAFGEVGVKERVGAF